MVLILIPILGEYDRITRVSDVPDCGLHQIVHLINRQVAHACRVL